MGSTSSSRGYHYRALTDEDKEHIHRCFEEMDTNNHGTISPKELRNWLWRHKLASSLQDIEDLVDTVDANNNKRITIEEFENALQKPLGNPNCTQHVLQKMIWQPSTYAVTGYICGSLANFGPQELARPINRILFPLGGIILGMGAYEQTKQRMALSTTRLNLLKEEIMYLAGQEE